MSKINVKLTRTAKKYAEALFETAQSKNETGKIAQELRLIVKTLTENENLQTFLENPIISIEDKKDTIRQIFSVDLTETGLNFLYLLCDNSRFNTIFEIQREYTELEKAKTGILTVKATTAVEMKDYLKDKLKDKLEKKLSKQIEIEYSINPEIIAGLIVEIEGKTIDSSINTKIKNIKKKLI